MVKIQIPKLRSPPRSRARRRPRKFRYLTVTLAEQNNCQEDRLFSRRRSPINRERARRRGRFPNFGIWVKIGNQRFLLPGLGFLSALARGEMNAKRCGSQNDSSVRHGGRYLRDGKWNSRLSGSRGDACDAIFPTRNAVVKK